MENDGSSTAAKPLFSIIIPTYNASHLVGATIDSALAQSFPDFEVIVVDDGSTDSTPDVLQSYGERVTALRQVNQGAEAARRNGAAHARGEYLVLLDHEDLPLDDALAVYARVIRSGEMPALIIARLSRFLDGEPSPGPMPRGADIEVLRYTNYFGRDRALAMGCSQLVIRRTVAEATRALRPTQTAFPYDSPACSASSAPTTIPVTSATVSRAMRTSAVCSSPSSTGACAHTVST